MKNNIRKLSLTLVFAMVLGLLWTPGEAAKVYAVSSSYYLDTNGTVKEVRSDQDYHYKEIDLDGLDNVDSELAQGGWIRFNTNYATTGSIHITTNTSIIIYDGYYVSCASIICDSGCKLGLYGKTENAAATGKLILTGNASGTAFDYRGNSLFDIVTICGLNVMLDNSGMISDPQCTEPLVKLGGVKAGETVKIAYCSVTAIGVNNYAGGAYTGNQNPIVFIKANKTYFSNSKVDFKRVDGQSLVMTCDVNNDSSGNLIFGENTSFRMEGTASSATIISADSAKFSIPTNRCFVDQDGRYILLGSAKKLTNVTGTSIVKLAGESEVSKTAVTVSYITVGGGIRMTYDGDNVFSSSKSYETYYTLSNMGSVLTGVLVGDTVECSGIVISAVDAGGAASPDAGIKTYFSVDLTNAVLTGADSWKYTLDKANSITTWHKTSGSDVKIEKVTPSFTVAPTATLQYLQNNRPSVVITPNDPSAVYDIEYSTTGSVGTWSTATPQSAGTYYVRVKLTSATNLKTESEGAADIYSRQITVTETPAQETYSGGGYYAPTVEEPKKTEPEKKEQEKREPGVFIIVGGKEVELKLEKDVKGEDRIYSIKFDPKDVEPGTIFYLYRDVDGTLVLPAAKLRKQKVDENGELRVAIPYHDDRTFVLETKEEAEKIDNRILLGVRAENEKEKLTVGKSNKIRLQTNSGNIKKITYTSTDKNIAKVGSKGKITAVSEGRCKIRVNVVLKNGAKRSFAINVNVK